MSPATLLLIQQIIGLLVTAATEAPALTALGQQAIAIVGSNADPTPEQLAAIQTSLDAANAALQSA